MPRTLAILALVVAAAAAGALWWFTRPDAGATELVLHGNVDLREAQLAFNNDERIVAVLVEEGDRVAEGQVLARVEATRLEPQVAQAEAQAEAQRQVVLRLRNGSRPEEIAQAEANLASARADAENARRQYARVKEASRGAVSLQDLENAQSALDVAGARVVVAEKALALARLGPRAEEVAEAEARRRASEALLAHLRKQLADTTLVAPVAGVVRSRILEPGEIASPRRPVLLLAIEDPKWVRAYVAETDLPRVRPGAAGFVTIDAFPGRRYPGWVGFVSPVAEFTPRTVQTEELRTSLVYEVRVFVRDPANDLRLGMPATVHLPLDPARTASLAPETTAGRTR